MDSIRAVRNEYELSLRAAQLRGNPESRRITLDCRASLAMTNDADLKQAALIQFDPT